MKCFLIALCAVFLVMSACAPAFAYRCGNKLIKVGNTRYEVLEYCGQPSWQDSWEEDYLESPRTYPFSSSGDFVAGRTRIATVVRVTVEEWVYNDGPSQFMRILTFENGKVVSIRTGNYGF
jgi:hypothetical protein